MDDPRGSARLAGAGPTNEAVASGDYSAATNAIGHHGGAVIDNEGEWRDPVLEQVCVRLEYGRPPSQRIARAVAKYDESVKAQKDRG